MRKKIVLSALTMLLLCISGSNSMIYSQGAIILNGKIYNSTTKKAVDFATVVVLEAGKKTYTGANGEYTIAVPKAGTYTVIVQSEQLATLKTRITLNKSTTRNFYLNPHRIKGATLTVTGKRDVQKISRYTMSRKNLKDVPGSFGDSINALTSMPGVIRTNGFFGPLVIRGASPIQNSYLIDEIPIYNPMHFGGIHSVINNNLMSEIDLFASSFPVSFGSANGAIISINTVDDVKEFGGYTDIGLISSSALIQTPILRNKKSGDVEFAPPALTPSKEDYDNAGYMIVSGRVGYISLFIPLIYRVMTGEKLEAVPQYWDYQAKFKYYLAPKHSITLLLMGSSDYWKFIDKGYISEDEGSDPLLWGLKFRINWKSNSQGLFYTWEPSDKFWNRVTAYSALIRYYSYLSLTAPEAASWAKDLNVDSRPYIFGGKERFKFIPIKDLLQFNGGLDYTYYHFTAKGKTIMQNTGAIEWDLGDETLATPILLDMKVINHTLGGFLESKVAFQGLEVVPGIRADYLKRSEETIYDPRGRISYEFPTDTTISAAGGRYSYFFQTNPFLFTELPNVTAMGDELRPERAIHRSAGIEQKVNQYNLKTEVFYNNFYDMAVEYYHYNESGEAVEGMNSGKLKTYGFEIMLKKDLRENEEGLFGWINYTYSRAKYKSGLPTTEYLYGDTRNQMGDPYGDKWITYEFEMKHNMKIVSGLNFKTKSFKGMHTISCKFQYYSSLPYTPIVGSHQDLNYSITHPERERYVPEYGYPNSKHFQNTHQLDIRYSYRVNHPWGYVSWYFEIINCYGYWYRPEDQQDWDWRYPYSPGNNPEVKAPDMALTWIPNFGVEVKF